MKTILILTTAIAFALSAFTILQDVSQANVEQNQGIYVFIGI